MIAYFPKTDSEHHVRVCIYEARKRIYKDELTDYAAIMFT